MLNTDNSKTIKYRVSLHGISLRSGEYTKITLCPSTTQGITFYTNNISNNIIPCSASSVIDTTFSTNLGADQISISTVEHLMSALHAYGIDCLDVTIDGDGVPILDGSAKHFCNLIEAAGIKELDKPKKYITISHKISINGGCGDIIAYPFDGFQAKIIIDFDHPLIGTQTYFYNGRCDYKHDIAPARTFIRLKDAQYLMNNGLIKGGTIDTAIVLDDVSVINTELKWPDEFVRHKVLDFLGDIYMHGPIKGDFVCKCSGHKTNNELLQKIVYNV